ncbi:GntR family transcriptional regulator [Zhengella mangrovi]|uniref:GntR family transcriptional regulator n=1 Tax=Zhengella mangrovi TaxID=1982044 RepID=A0A2G1QQF1_9HYPH|nr:GntR family transcriptional regulator [Zhengella mangrovi]PHP67680.1 GntR family transcriptional regulator [Zhengella mangrovi]
MTIQQPLHRQLDTGAAVGPQVYRLLRERIIRSELEPGTRISETEIAGDYAVSRQPVREAFIKLAEEGLLEIRPQRGTFVRKIAVPSVMDARFVREAIEADIVRQLAQAPVSGLEEELRGLLAAQAKAAGAGDWLRFIELDERFHRALADGAGKAYAWNVVEGVKAQMDRVRHLSAQRFPMDKLVEQHTAIVDGISGQNPDAAERAMRAHLREILNDLPAIAGSRPEYFEEAVQS